MVNDKIIDRLKSIGALKEALLAQKLGNGAVKCNICQRRCQISEGGVGYCRTKVNYQGTLYCMIYGVISSAAADPIEKKPVFHFKPGSRVFSVGSLGCNFRCVFCQNWEIAYADVLNSEMYNIVSPEKLIQLTVNNDCDGIAWTYNEPGIWLNYTLDCARAAKKQGLYTVYVTNGYATFEHLDLIAPYLDVYRVDIKSMNDDFYKKLIKVSSVKGVLDTIHRAKTKWGLHIECVTNIIPGWNDSEENLRLTARWIAENIGKNTPWHVTRFFPYGELSNINPTPIETLQLAYNIGRKEGLNFVYIGNARTQNGENTYCPECGNLAIRRIGYNSEILGVTREGKCSVDGTDLNVKL